MGEKGIEEPRDKLLKRENIQNSATISDLDYNTSYKVKVRAYNEKYDEYGTYSDIKSFKTEEDDTIEVGKVKNIDIDVNGNRVDLDWSKVTNADEYEVYLSKNSGSYDLIGTVKNNNATISNLSYNTSYKIKIRAYNKKYDEYGAYSDIESFKTEKNNSSINNEEVGKVKNVNASVTGSTVYLSWKSVPGAVKYEIQFTVPGYGGATSIWSEGPGVDTSRLD